MAQSYDLVVIGAGSGGVRAARMAATYGARVAIVEEYRVGGTCVIRGCVPKKLFVYASRFKDSFEVAESFGWQVDASFDWATLLANKNKEIDRLESAYVHTLENHDVEIFRDRAVIEDSNTVRLVNGGHTLHTRHILVATGGHPHKPAIPGAEHGITSNEAFLLERLPESILIEGGGYIAAEFATIFAGIGVHTTVNYRRDKILRGFDNDLRQALEEGMRGRGIRFHYNASVASIKKLDGHLEVNFSDGESARYGAVMFATGRTPNVDGLGLESVGVGRGANGAIQVDAYSATNVPSIHAVGDVTDRAQLTPVAIREGAAFAETVFNDNPTAVDHSLIPTAVFAEPELATIGPTEEDAARERDLDVYVTSFRPMMNTLSDKVGRMVFKLIAEKASGKVIACHLLGPGAAEMIQLVAVPIAMGAGMADFNRAIAVHPTAAEELVTFKAPSYCYEGGRKVMA